MHFFWEGKKATSSTTPSVLLLVCDTLSTSQSHSDYGTFSLILWGGMTSYRIISRLGWVREEAPGLSSRKNGEILIGPCVGDLEKKNISDERCNFSISFLGIPTAVFPELFYTIYFKTPFHFWSELLALKHFVMIFLDPSVRNKANILLDSWHIKCNSHWTSRVTSSAY